MLRNRGKGKNWIAGVCVLVAALILVILFRPGDAPKEDVPDAQLTQKQNDGSQPGTPDSPAGDSGMVTGKIKKEAPIQYNELDNDEPLKTMMTDRKKSLGIKKSLDMIVKSDETFTVGKNTVSMQKILEKAFVEKGQVFEEEISDSGETSPSKINAYGIYVVQPGDNIWNIHFRILKDYYASKGIRIEQLADEPGSGGKSSGVGKILKFSETMVIIYNMVEEKVTQDINIIEPLSKVVVYNMDAVFSLLEEVDFENVDRLQFDGKNIWIPANT